MIVNYVWRHLQKRLILIGIWKYIVKNLLLSTSHSPSRKSDFSNPVAWLHLFNNLLLSAYHSPPRKNKFLHPWEIDLSESWLKGICDYAPDEDHMGSELFIIILLSNSNKCNCNCDKCGLLTVRRGKMKRHIKAVHRDGCFDMKTGI